MMCRGWAGPHSSPGSCDCGIAQALTFYQLNPRAPHALSLLGQPVLTWVLCLGCVVLGHYYPQAPPPTWAGLGGHELLGKVGKQLPKGSHLGGWMAAKSPLYVK